MSGIYIHIPYCKKVCNYCDFHFSASMHNKGQMVQSICNELVKQNQYLSGKAINTVYFGGGTPSVLTLAEIGEILNILFQNFPVEKSIEFTFETNPDDISKEYLKGLKSLGINRLSIGIQSFHDSHLQWMNRRHTADEAFNSVKLALDNGFENINIDLIYGLPNSSIEVWEKDLTIFHTLAIPHLSAYHLTIEPKTVLGVWKKHGKIQEIPEEVSLIQYEILLEKMDKWGYVNYEISNFCKEGHCSQHNLNYWNQGPYLGVGPSAHSFNGKSRQWNVPINQKYINLLAKNEIWYDMEDLTLQESYNDYLLTHLRTIWGIDLNEINDLYGEKLYQYLIKETKHFLSTGLVEIENNRLKLTKKGKFVANSVISGLMFVK